MAVMYCARRLAASSARERERRPDLRAHGKVETRRRDADDLVLAAVDVDRLPDDRRVGGESALPQAVAEHDAPMPSDGLFFGQKRAAGGRLRRRASAKKSARDEKSLHVLGLVPADEVDRPPLERGEVLERAALPPEVEVVGRARWPRGGFVVALA